MIDPDRDARAAALDKLAKTREKLRALLEPEKHAARSAEAGEGHPGAFPRSRTMQMLLSGKGLGTVGALVGGVIAARPAMALRLLRMVPASAVGKMLLAKGVGVLRDRYMHRR